MSLKEFSENDIFNNSLITFPRYEFRISNGKIGSKNYVDGELKLNDLLVDDTFGARYGILKFDNELNSWLIALI